MDRETYLLEAIREIGERARREAQPYVDELMKLESLKPPPVFVIPADLDLTLPAAQAHILESRKILQDSPAPDESAARHSPPQLPETPEPPLR